MEQEELERENQKLANKLIEVLEAQAKENRTKHILNKYAVQVFAIGSGLFLIIFLSYTNPELLKFIIEKIFEWITK